MEDMVAIQPLLDAQSNCLMVHLAAHGRSSGHHRPLEPGDWFSAIDSLLAAEGLAFDGTLIGYSLGGRMALSWWAREPERFSRVVLMAPDGLVKNVGYRFAVDTAVGRAWLGQSERQRERIVRHMGWLRRRGLLPEHFYQFSLFHLETAEMWQMVIDCWLSLRRFWPPGRRTLRRLAAAHPGENVLVFSHGGAIGCGLEELLPGQRVPHITNCSISSLSVPAAGGPCVAGTLGDSAHVTNAAQGFNVDVVR